MQHRAFRMPSSAPVALISGNTKVSAQILNIHRDGAKLAFEPGNLDLFSAVEILVRGNRWRADVMWFSGRHIGIKFDPALPPYVVNMLARRKGGRPGDALGPLQTAPPRYLRAVGPSLQNHTL